MNNTRLPLIAGIIVVLLAIVGYSSTFTVPQTQQAIVLQFGDPKRTVSEPGLHFKLPFLQSVVYVENRVLNLDPPAQTIILRGQLRLVVDAFVRYRIVDPLRFIQAIGSEAVLEGTLGSVVNDATRGVLGEATLADVLSSKRAEMMTEIRTRVNREAERFGIVIVDMRIGRADLAPDVSESVFNRMRAERQRDANEFRAQGQEQSQIIKAQADREATVIRAEATRQSDILRGEGEAERIRLLNEVTSKDPEFFQFFRSMQAYRDSLDPTTSYLVLTMDSDFFRYFRDAKGDWSRDPGDLPPVGTGGATDSGGIGGN